MKNYYSIHRLLKNVNILQVGTGKNPAIPLYSDKKIVKMFRTKRYKNNKKRTCF